MRHCAQLAIWAASLLYLQPIFGAPLDDLVPAPKLRPAEVTRFSSGSVKMGAGDIDEIKSRLIASKREPLARRLTDKSSLGVLATNLVVLSELATSPSFKLQEWALNALG